MRFIGSCTPLVCPLQRATICLRVRFPASGAARTCFFEIAASSWSAYGSMPTHGRVARRNALLCGLFIPKSGFRHACMREILGLRSRNNTRMTIRTPAPHVSALHPL
jgi:hypothetical protein